MVELESNMRETFKLEGTFTLLYKDAEFGEDYLLTSTGIYPDLNKRLKTQGHY